jgi:transposase InsO family protein
MSDRKRSHQRAKRGNRYTPGEKQKILGLAERIGVSQAAERLGASPWTIYRWRHDRALKASRADANGEHLSKPGRIQVPDSIQRQVIEVWKNNPGFGPSQVRNQLRRVGVRCDTKTIRKILRAHGYSPPSRKPPRSGPTRRFEASRPLELVQMDVLHFYVHAQKLYLLLALDDHSRFISGWALLQRESMEDAIALMEEAIRRYGKPETILTDRGATFHSWSGIGHFDRMLEAYGIDHILASPGHPQTCGKIEAVNKAIQKELIDRVEFRNYLDAKEQIARWVDTYNHQRTHQGIGGVLVPADRFFGRADRVLQRIEAQHAGGRERSPVPPELQTDEENRRICLCQLVLQADTLELWLFGRLIARLHSPVEA